MVEIASDLVDILDQIMLHHLLDQTITVSLAIKAILYLLLKYSTHLIVYGMVRIAVLVKLVVVSVLLFLGFISLLVIILLIILR